MARTADQKSSLRTQLAVYGSGMFWDCGSNVVIPLWLITLHPTPFEFGWVIGCRALLPCLFSIHGGMLMDRLGVRRVMLAIATVGLLPPILNPMLPTVWAAGVLQLVAGFTTSTSWVGAQTAVSQNLGGDRSYFARLSFGNRLGALICPSLAGACWDAFGPWGGFGVLFAGSVILLICAWMLPEPPAETPRPAPALREWVPKAGDYLTAFRLIGIPAVMIVSIASVLNVGTGAIQQSFYVAYLEKIHLSGTLIGILVSAPNIVALTGTLSLGKLIRWMGDMRLLNAAVVVSIITATVTPTMSAFLPLFAVGLIRGWGQGISQPLMISIPSNSVPPGAEGASVGLRITLNRIVQTLLPPVMGVVVGIIGLENSFYVVGGTLAVLICVALYMTRDKMPPWPSRGG
jgi:DHA1 family inner membrane transport protein